MGGGQHNYIYLDIQDVSSIEICGNFISEKYDTLDVLVNNAGIWPMPIRLEDMTVESVKKIFEVNIYGLVMLTKAVLPMIKKSHGVIINNASIAGMESFTSGQSYAYAASKSAVVKFTKMLAKQYGNTFRTNCVCPGLIRTPIHQNFNEEKLKEKIPVNRVGEPEDVAAVVSFLASGEASFVNGCVLPIDGGQSL